MKIIQVSKRFVTEQWGERETFFSQTSARLRSRGVDTQVFTTTAGTDQGLGYVSRFPFFYPVLGLSETSKQRLNLNGGDPYSFSLYRALKQYKQANLIHLSAGKRLGAQVRSAAKRNKIPYLVSLTGEFFSFPHPRTGSAHSPESGTEGAVDWGRLLDLPWKTHRILEDASAIICSGRDDFTAASRKFPEKKVVHLPNGVDPNRFLHSNPAWFRKLYRIPEDRFLILSVDPIEMRKNQLTMIRQLPDILDKAPDVHLVCIGEVRDHAYFKRLLKEISLQKLKKRVTIIPGLPYESQDLVNAYGAADAYIVPALYDAFGTSVLEAWSAGLPVAASKRGGPGYLVEHGLTGVLFDPEAPARFTESMKNALIELALNRDARERYAAAGREKVLTTYTWDIITDQLLQLYQEISSSP